MQLNEDTKPFLWDMMMWLGTPGTPYARPQSLISNLFGHHTEVICILKHEIHLSNICNSVSISK